MPIRIAATGAAGAAVAVTLLLSSAAAAQERPKCRETREEDMRTGQMLLARAYDCTELRFAQSLRLAADKVEKGYRNDPPDWRSAKDAYEFLARHYEGRKVNSMAWHDWVLSLTRLSEYYETGRPGSGWPQDFVLAREYQSRLVTGLEAAPDADTYHLRNERQRLADLDLKLALQRRRSGRWTGDIRALSQINRFTLRDDDLGAARLEADGMTGVISEIERVEVDPEENPRYVIRANIYLRQPLDSTFVGLCLVLTNGDEPADKPGRRGGILFRSMVTGQQYAVSSGPFQGRYRLITTQGYVPIQWSPTVVPRSFTYEFRPVTDKALCPAEM